MLHGIKGRVSSLVAVMNNSYLILFVHRTKDPRSLMVITRKDLLQDPGR